MSVKAFDQNILHTRVKMQAYTHAQTHAHAHTRKQAHKCTRSRVHTYTHKHSETGRRKEQEDTYTQRPPHFRASTQSDLGSILLARCPPCFCQERTALPAAWIQHPHPQIGAGGPSVCTRTCKIFCAMLSCLAPGKHTPMVLPGTCIPHFITHALAPTFHLSFRVFVCA